MWTRLDLVVEEDSGLGLGWRSEVYLIIRLDVEFDFLACEGADSVHSLVSSLPLRCFRTGWEVCAWVRLT